MSKVLNPDTSNPSQLSQAEKLVYSMTEVARVLSVCRRTIERERSAGRFPKPDLHIGKRPLWTKESLLRWIANGGRSG
ncbi:MAG: helix-turn-helix transcriptional regulator [Isosphaerales bacterium]